MSYQSAFVEILAESRDEPSVSYLRRKLDYKVLPRKAVVLKGVRRSGKSTLLRQIQEDERASGRTCLHMNFIDERLSGLEARDLGGIFDAFHRVHPKVGTTQTLSLLLDEPQVVADWESFVERQLRIAGRRVFITGSSAKLLSKEIASSMRGRSLSYEVFPFSFPEFLEHQGNLPRRMPPGGEEKAAIKARFHDYLMEGGFPEVIGLDRPIQVQILQEYLDVLLLRDVIERHNASSPVTVKRLLILLLTRFGGTFTINRCVELLKAQGLGASKANISEMIEWFADAYAVFPVKMFSESVQKQNTNPKKLYVIDNGLINAVNIGRNGNEGRLLENLVFMTLRRRSPDIHYVKTRDGYEVDFHSEESGLIQVAWSIDDEATRKRELRALEQAMEELHLPESILITADHTETIKLSSGVVHTLPAWEWSLA